MKLGYKLLLIGFLTIGIFDALSSIVSKQFNFNYVYLASCSFVIYCLVGFFGSKKTNLKTGVLIAAGVGFFDATVGWKISMLLKANTGDLKNDPSISIWVITTIFVTVVAALCGFVGSWVASYNLDKKL